MHDIQRGQAASLPLVFNFQKALNIPSFLSFLIIPNILIIQITQNFLITPILPANILFL